MPFSDHFKGAVHHHKRFRVDTKDNVFQFGQLSKCGNGKKSLLFDCWYKRPWLAEKLRPD
jgi:hypothetical protein